MVSGPGTLNFYWKVSSEANADSLEFYIDCIKQDSISGDVDWHQKSYEISPGTHTLMWKYTKNGDTDSGSDCGWRDTVEFSGGPGPTPTGYLWCTDDGWGKGYSNKIFKLDTAGNVITSFDAPQNDSYSGGLAWDGASLWYVRDYTAAYTGIFVELYNEIYQEDTQST